MLKSMLHLQAPVIFHAGWYHAWNEKWDTCNFCYTDRITSCPARIQKNREDCLYICSLSSWKLSANLSYMCLFHLSAVSSYLFGYHINLYTRPVYIPVLYINVHIPRKQKNLEFVRHFCLDYFWWISSLNNLIRVCLFWIYPWGTSGNTTPGGEKSISQQPILNFNIHDGFQFSPLAKPYTWNGWGTSGNIKGTKHFFQRWRHAPKM